MNYLATLKEKLMNQTGGGDSIFNMYIHYIIGIILIVLGIILIKLPEKYPRQSQKTNHTY